MKEYEAILSGGDLRSLGRSKSIISKINSQNDFDELFEYLFHNDRRIVMRSADAIEKITIKNPFYLAKHKNKVVELLYAAKNIELKWHLAVLVSRLHLDNVEFGKIWDTLTKWAKDKTNSRLVRVGAVQGLFEMTKQKNNLVKSFKLTMLEIEKEAIPSINARIRNIRKEIG